MSSNKTQKTIRKGKTGKKTLALHQAGEVYRQLKDNEGGAWNGTSAHHNAVAVEGRVPGLPGCTEWIRFRSQSAAAKLIGLKHDAMGVKNVIDGTNKTTGGGWVFRRVPEDVEEEQKQAQAQQDLRRQEWQALCASMTEICKKNNWPVVIV